MPFELSDRKIVVAVRNWEELKPFGFDGPICYCKVVDKDVNGIWIANDDWPLAPAGPGSEEFRAIQFMIPWSNVVAIGLFPKERPMAQPGKIRSVV